jgi:hypothetical protein
MTIPEKNLSRPAEEGTQNGNTASDGNQSLSDKLDKSGVIKPAEGVDPQIVQPAPVPDPNSTPVIPPAGTLSVRPDQSPNSLRAGSTAGYRAISRPSGSSRNFSMVKSVW